MKDLDKIKELVATCDSTNIELAITIGVNMEGYDRGELRNIIIDTIENNKYKIYNFEVKDGGSTISVNNHKLSIFGVITHGMLLYRVGFNLWDLVESWIDTYLSL